MATIATVEAEATSLDRMIEAAAAAADYREGFGVTGCDLDGSALWAMYTRQSTEEQRTNNRLPEYLLTCAREAKSLGVVVPREYVLYDAVTGEHLERPMMTRLRQELAPRRKLAGVIFPAVDRLSREPIHIGIFEFELDHSGVRYHYADAPNGSDPMSQMVRQNLAHVAKFVKLANRKNNRGGNVGRVLKGMVPAHRAPYGYVYRAEYVDDGPRRTVVRAWWEVDSLDASGALIEGSPAWAVRQIFEWLGGEGRTLHWVTRKLNERGVLTNDGAHWNPSKLQRLAGRSSYRGEHLYNRYVRVPDPDRPLGDITAEIKRTREREKPETEWVRLEVPALVSTELWESANAALRQRGRGRGREGRKILALLRGRLFCPRCERPMIVRRAGRQAGTYYHCSKYHSPVTAQRCDFRRFIPAEWDEVIWNDVCSLLRDDRWVEAQFKEGEERGQGFEKLMRVERDKMASARAKIARVREGFEGNIYTLDEAKSRIAELEKAVSRAKEELRRLEKRSAPGRRSGAQAEALRQELRRMRDRNLDDATFDQRVDLISRLGIGVYPSEDLATAKVTCLFEGAALPAPAGSDTKTDLLVARAEPAVEGAEVTFTPPYGIRTTHPQQP